MHRILYIQCGRPVAYLRRTMTHRILDYSVRLGNTSVRDYSSKRRQVVSIWNTLPNCVVSPNTTDTFKARLDKFWYNQDIVYDFRAQLQGTGSRSEVLYE